MSQLSRICGPVTRIALLSICTGCPYLTENETIGLQELLRNNFSFLYVDDVRISEEIHLWGFTACYRGNFTVLYIDDVHTAKEI
jgi:hypothetical protein